MSVLGERFIPTLKKFAFNPPFLWRFLLVITVFAAISVVLINREIAF